MMHFHHLHDNAEASSSTQAHKKPTLEPLIHCNLENALQNVPTVLMKNEVSSAVKREYKSVKHGIHIL